jgi:hypothetical protein
MAELGLILVISGFYPIGRAWRANRQTSLRQALAWFAAAWVLWGCVFLDGKVSTEPGTITPYFALCGTGCAGVAVLGARRPGVDAWNIVVLGLLSVLLLPLAESLLGGRALSLDGPRTLFLAGTLAVGLLNYVPTPMAPAVLLFGAGSAVEILRIHLFFEEGDVLGRLQPFSRCLLAVTPWIALASARQRRTGLSEIDRLWLGFRDRFGFVWGKRLQEQFNRAAAHAGWPVYLSWQGLRVRPDPGASSEQDRDSALEALLRDLFKRFGPI